MRIRFVISNAYASSGIVRTTFTMASELAAQGHKVEIISMARKRGRMRLRPPDPRVKVHPLYDAFAFAREPDKLSTRQRLAKSYFLRLQGQPSRLIHPDDSRYKSFNRATDFYFKRYLRSLDSGVIIGTRPGFNLAIAKYVSPDVVRVAQDHTHFSAYKPALQAEMRKHYPKLDLVTSLTHPDAADYREALGDGVRVVRIPNSVSRKRRPRADLDAKVIVSAGRLSMLKGYDRLITAFATALKDHPDWELRIFGGRGRTHSTAERLQRQIDELGISDRARLMGFSRKLQLEMSKSSVYALASRREGFPMVLLEAMASGCAVVSFDCPFGPSDAIEDGVNGFLVPDDDVDAFVSALSKLMADRELRSRFATAGVETAKTYRPSAVARDLARELAKLVREKRQTRS